MDMWMKASTWSSDFSSSQIQNANHSFNDKQCIPWIIKMIALCRLFACWLLS